MVVREAVRTRPTALPDESGRRRTAGRCQLAREDRRSRHVRRCQSGRPGAAAAPWQGGEAGQVLQLGHASTSRWRRRWPRRGAGVVKQRAADAVLVCLAWLGLVGAGLAGRMEKVRARPQSGMATAEYAVATLAAVAFAGVLLAVLRSNAVRELLLGIIQRALAV